MIQIPHPSDFLKTEWIDCIREEATSAEQQGSLTHAQLELIYEQGWFKLFIPNESSQPGLSLPDALRLEEALSWADGSLGWTVTLCSGAGWFGGFFNNALAHEVFRDREVCLGGSGAPTGTATRVENGYLINGKWKYATGADHLTHFTANCIIKEGDETMLNETGEPLITPFVFEKDEVIIIKDWNTIGLLATSSQSFKVNDLFVSAARSFNLAPESLKINQPIYNYPFLQFAEVTLAVNISGMALHFLDCCTEIFAKRVESKSFKDVQKNFLTENLNVAQNKMARLRTEFYQTVNESWQLVKKNHSVPEQFLQKISLTSRNLAAASLEVVDKLYPLCGLLAANPASEINRVWRDIHTASQHSLLTLP